MGSDDEEPSSRELGVGSPPSDPLGDVAMMGRVASQLFGEEPVAVTVGRFVVESTIGVGGMGIVVQALDPKLGRRVAIKLLRALGEQEETLARRLEQEALALARLSHPNVVQVFEVGEHQGQVFLAMEYVDGGSLRDWRIEEPRSWHEILDKYLQAGAGLAAAHRVGIIHRDFKPANALIGKDGRVRVADFGLAREVPSVEQRPGAPDPSMAPASSTIESLTRSGAVVGTPAYMSPEQIVGYGVDVRSDVFSYCVALWEALSGWRPYRYEHLRWVLEERGDPPPISGRPAGPKWLGRALRRGLAIDASRRWSSMAELLAALEQAPVRRRRATAGLGIAALGLGGWTVWGSDRVDPCPSPAIELAGIWDDARREELEGVIEAAGLAFGSQTWRLVEGRLDAYASAWVDARQHACEATKVHGRQSEEQLDLSVHCLDQRLDHVMAAVDVLAEGRVEAIVEGVVLVDRLPPLAPCASTPHLRTVHEQPLDRSPSARALDLRVAQAQAYLTVQLPDDARKLADDAVVEAQRLGDRVRWAEALAVRGRAEVMIGDGARADASLRESMLLALEVADLELAARDWIALGRVAAVELEDSGRARDWLDQAGSFIEGQAPIEGLVVELAVARAELAVFDGSYDEALAGLQRVRQGLETDDPATIEVLGEEANLLGEAGRLEESDARYEQVIERLSARLGEDHPSLARWRVNQAINELGKPVPDLERAQGLCEHALARYGEVYGEHDRRLAGILVLMGSLAHARGELDEARGLAERAVDIVHKQLPVGHSERAGALALLGNVQIDAGRHTEAIATHQALVSEYDAGGDAAERPKARQNLAWLLCEAERCVGAQGQIDAARAELMPGDALHVLLDVVQGRVLLASGDAAGAVRVLEAVMSRAEPLGVEHPRLAVELEDALARAREAQGP